MKGRKMSFQRIFLPAIFLPGFQSDRSEAFFNLIVQVEIIWPVRLKHTKVLAQVEHSGTIADKVGK